MGLGELDMRLRLFQSMNAVDRMRRKLSDWERRRRGEKEVEEEEWEGIVLVSVDFCFCLVGDCIMISFVIPAAFGARRTASGLCGALGISSVPQ